MAVGAGAIVYSLMTAYELGAAKVISMPTHLTIDFISGAFLAASPWIFNFADEVYLPHLIVGILEIGASLMTKTQTSSSSAMHSGHHAV
ncbi:MAG TPA: SPW repeat protein [Flavobacterium sp.]|nr:SPW repeat protein [Flavobacterium sp.]